MFLPKLVTYINSFEIYPTFLNDPILKYILKFMLPFFILQQRLPMLGKLGADLIFVIISYFYLFEPRRKLYF